MNFITLRLTDQAKLGNIKRKVMGVEMVELFNGKGEEIDLSKCKVLSNKGSECVVYVNGNRVIKLFKEDYQSSHLTIEEINFLKTLPTKRILFPDDVVLNVDEKLCGYEMPLIVGEKDIQQEVLDHVLDEMQVLKKDLEIIGNYDIVLRDISVPNSIYNGQLYLIDPGNYKIDGGSLIKAQVDPFNLCKNEKLLIKNWNYNKINQLFDALLFSKSKNVDPYQYRQIVQFFIKERKIEKLDYNLKIFKKYFNCKLPVCEATKQFMKDHIKENAKERALFLSGTVK